MTEMEKQNYLLNQGDILFNRTNSKELVGKCCVVDFSQEYVFASYLIRVRLNTKRLNSKFVTTFLASELGRLQIDAVSRQIAGMTNINTEEIKNLWIPMVDKEMQRAIEKEWNLAIEKREQQTTAAAALLDSIDTYLLSELGITPPKETNNALQNRIFRRKISTVIGNRFDPFSYFQNYKIEGGCYLNYALKELSTISKGQSITSNQIVAGAYPVIAGGQTSPYTHNVFNVTGDSITVSASGAYSGFVWYHETPIFASDCSVIKSKNEEHAATHFLAEVLKLKQKEIYLLQRGAGQPHVYPNDLARLQIPLPPLQKQHEIVAHVSAIRAQAAALKLAAATAFAQAKQDIEKMILSPSPATATTQNTSTIPPCHEADPRRTQTTETFLSNIQPTRNKQ
jgi:restriction endonuclease S subunit